MCFSLMQPLYHHCRNPRTDCHMFEGFPQFVLQPCEFHHRICTQLLINHPQPRNCEFLDGYECSLKVLELQKVNEGGQEHL